ncbi:threonine-phosphate decarboxylase CobD [Peribacillus frigoritolerans]|uniref:threonine-phosphate decarboxylase CobD n=1 Tax=Peribacillus frigoritolerans TaxID=450367 RepID=UPI000D02406D|nr:threonine-phosphate decarboxylase [Bacillus sp. RJGP41]
MTLPSHGSNPHYLYEALKIEMPESVLDFSANINPLGPPLRIKQQWSGFFEGILQYPDPHAIELTKSIAKKEALPEQSVLMGNGGAEIIMLVANGLANQRVLIIQPAFAEYAEACLAAGCKVDFHQLDAPGWQLDLERLIPRLPEYDAIFLCTPNNPTGVSFKRDTVRELIIECQKADCLVVLDEAFYDFTEDAFSYASLINAFPHLLILRSMTKIFAIPGLRLGYLLASPDIIKRVRNYKPHWSVNHVALEVGKICLAEEAYMRKTRDFIAWQKQKLFRFYEEQGLDVSDSTVNFYLVKDESLSLFPFLLKKGIVPRHTYNFPGLDGRWLRFAVKSEHDNEALMEGVRQWRKQGSVL